MAIRNTQLALTRALAAVGLAFATPTAAAQISVKAVEIVTEIGEARGYAAVIDLADPQLEISVGVTDAPEGRLGKVRLVSTESWASSAGLDLAVNTNFFGTKSDGTADIVGLCVAGGRTISEARSFRGSQDPVLVVYEDGRAAIRLGLDDDDPRRVVHAIAGVGGSEQSEVAGTLLVTDGVNTGASARVQPMARHPRTAAGVSADGKTLYLVVVDGRQEGWSVGVTLPELADLLLDLGADDAVNLDGGGSSSFVWLDDNALMTNRPSDGGFRPVAVSIGFRVAEREPAGEAG